MDCSQESEPGPEEATEESSLESLQQQIDELRRQLQLRSGIDIDIAECSQRVESLAMKVVSAESEVESAKGELKAAKEKYEIAVRELRELVRDQAVGQQRLPFDSPSPSPSQSQPVASAPSQAADGEPAQPAEAPSESAALVDEHAGDSIDFLSQKYLREMLGVDEFNRLKEIEQPVGLTEKELDLLAQTDATTIGGLEKMMREDSHWFSKMGRGWGEAKTNKLINSLFAFRQKYPQPV